MQWSCLFFGWACLCTAAQVGQACFHAIKAQQVTVKPWAASPELHNLVQQPVPMGSRLVPSAFEVDCAAAQVGYDCPGSRCSS